LSDLFDGISLKKNGLVVGVLYAYTVQVRQACQLSVSPEMLEVIKLPCLRLKDMDHHISVVYCNPERIVLSVDGKWLHLHLVIDLMTDVAGNSLHLVAGVALAYDEVITYRIVEMLEATDDDLLSLFVLYSVDDSIE
jgi:hypothetical protein